MRRTFGIFGLEGHSESAALLSRNLGHRCGTLAALYLFVPRGECLSLHFLKST
jgi:hypothetical protein